MKRNKKNIFWAILAISICSTILSFGEEPRAQRPPIEVNAAIDKSVITIGDKITYTITVAVKKDIEVEFPNFGENLGNFTIRDFGLTKKTFLGKQKFMQWYVINTYTTGKATIPRVTLRYKNKGETEWHTRETEDFPIEIKSVLAGNNSIVDMQDIEGPVSMPRRLNRFLLVGIFIAALAAALYVTFFFVKKPARGLPIMRPAYERALERLEALQKRGLVSQGKIKEYYSEISDIIRHYIEDRFNLKAPEMTTEEFLNTAGDSLELQRGHTLLLREFLTACDLVKFAKYFPAVDEADAVFQSAKRLVEQTKEKTTASLN